MYVAKENSPTTFSKGLLVASGRIVKQTLRVVACKHSAAISGNKRPWCEGDQREPDSARMLIYVGTQALELSPTPTHGRVGGSGERAVPSPLTPSSVTPRPFGNPMQPREQGTKHVELRPPLSIVQAHSHSRSLDARARQTLNEEGGGVGRTQSERSGQPQSSHRVGDAVHVLEQGPQVVLVAADAHPLARPDGRRDNLVRTTNSEQKRRKSINEP